MYSRFLTKNSVVEMSCDKFFIFDALSFEYTIISLTQNNPQAFAIWPTKYVLSSNDCALSMIEEGTTMEIVNALFFSLQKFVFGYFYDFFFDLFFSSCDECDETD